MLSRPFGIFPDPYPRGQGGFGVVYRGYDIEDEEITEAVGREKSGAKTVEGCLYISFFGLFFGSSVVSDS